MRACSDPLFPSAGVFEPERNRPSAILHSNVAMLSSLHAVRTMLTACISSDVSITTMGVDELMRTFRRSSPSVISGRTKSRSHLERSERTYVFAPFAAKGAAHEDKP